MTVSARGLGGDDGEQDGPGGQVAGAEEVVGRAPLVARDPEADAEREGEVEPDDGEVECVQGTSRLAGEGGTTNEGPSAAMTGGGPLRISSERAAQAVKLLPQPQPPVALGLLNVKPEPCIELT